MATTVLLPTPSMFLKVRFEIRLSGSPSMSNRVPESVALMPSKSTLRSEGVAVAFVGARPEL